MDTRTFLGGAVNRVIAVAAVVVARVVVGTRVVVVGVLATVVVGLAVVVVLATVAIGLAVVVGGTVVVVATAVAVGATVVVCASSASTFSRNACNSAESELRPHAEAINSTAKATAHFLTVSVCHPSPEGGGATPEPLGVADCDVNQFGENFYWFALTRLGGRTTRSEPLFCCQEEIRTVGKRVSDYKPVPEAYN